MHTSEAASVHAGPPGGALGRISPPMSSLTGGAAGGTTSSKSRADVDSAERALIRVRQKLQVCQGGEMIGRSALYYPVMGGSVYDCTSS